MVFAIQHIAFLKYHSYDPKPHSETGNYLLVFAFNDLCNNIKVKSWTWWFGWEALMW